MSGKNLAQTAATSFAAESLLFIDQTKRQEKLWRGTDYNKSSLKQKRYSEWLELATKKPAQN